jgi:triosephosphate isomerase
MLRLPFADAQGKLMKKTLIVANWKENLTATQAKGWVDELNRELGMSASGDPSDLRNYGKAEIVVCPPFILIPLLHSSFIIHNSLFHLGAQDVSKFEGGQYTGEVSAKMLKDFVDYVIVGHSERRRHFGETDEDVSRKIEQCLKYNLTPIVCVSKIEEVGGGKWDVGKTIFAYEPLAAIGTGEPDTPENANDFAQKIKAEIGQNVRVLYGGSVTAENVQAFVSQSDIDGILVGKASLDAEEFVRLCNSAIHCASGAN